MFAQDVDMPFAQRRDICSVAHCTPVHLQWWLVQVPYPTCLGHLAGYPTVPDPGVWPPINEDSWHQARLCRFPVGLVSLFERFTVYL